MIKTGLATKLQNYNFEELFKKKGYAFFTKGYYNLNIIGVRHNTNKVTNVFDDFIIVDYVNSDDMHKRYVWSATTKPGLTIFKNPTNPKGAPLLVPNQYRGTWTIGKHRGKYKALVQCKQVSVYRDNNKDDIIDLLPEKTDKGLFGINIHKASDIKDPTVVNNWSAGCQVFQHKEDFTKFMRLVEKQVASGLGNKFTYTLVNETDL